MSVFNNFAIVLEQNQHIPLGVGRNDYDSVLKACAVDSTNMSVTRMNEA